MKIALVTTSRELRSGIGDYTRRLLPHLREHCEVEVFVEPSADPDGANGERPITKLGAGEHDRILFQVGNEIAHGFMGRAVRLIGGAAVLHDWVLFDMAIHGFPALARGGVKGRLLAMREGGWEQARTYHQNWMERRRLRLESFDPGDCSDLEGVFLGGWHETESGSRWTTDRACLRIPGNAVGKVTLRLNLEPGRTLRLLLGDLQVASTQAGSDVLTAELDNLDQPLLVLETSGIRVTAEQRMHGDGRRLGAFVRSIAWEDASGQHALDLDLPTIQHVPSVTLDRDRFELPLNHSVVRFADAFIVHSEFMGERILADRNDRTPIATIPHGARLPGEEGERPLDEEARRSRRAQLGLPSEWGDDLLLVSFGGVQIHKRIDRVLQGVALARQQGVAVRLVLAGSNAHRGIDASALAAEYGIADAVHCTGFVPAEVGLEWLRAGDLAINLRGPTTGGTSGGIFQAFAACLPVIATDACEQSELPDACTLKVPLGEGEVEAIAAHLGALAADPVRLAGLRAAVRQYVATECAWGVVATRYSEALERFPRARVRRRDLISLRTDLNSWERTRPLFPWERGED